MPKEILIADSDKVDQKEFQRIFATTGYHLIFSESGEDALLRAKLFKPDMIIASGSGLEEKGGLELCGAIKGDPDFKQVPFILISSIFDEISEKDRKRSQADGVISKPLNEGEVLALVGNLMEEEAAGKKGEMASEKQEFSMGEMGDEQEEIIELLDVVEEPEPRMSIDSFVPTVGREKSIPEATSLDSWEKLDFEEKPLEKELGLRPEKKIGGTDLRVKRKVPLRETSPEGEIFDRIELEEILEQVEHLKPSLEKEWPSEKEGKGVKRRPPQIEEPAEKLDLSGFEDMLRKEAKVAQPREVPEVFPFEEVKTKIAASSLSTDELVEEPVEESLEQSLEEPVEEPVEEPIEESLEESLKEPEEESFEESLDEPVQVEELKELEEEEFPDEFFEDILEEEEIIAVGKVEELGPAEPSSEEVRTEEIEKIEEIGKIEQLEQSNLVEPEPVERIEEIRVDRLEEVQAPDMIREEAPPTAMAVNQQMQEVISQKVQEMMGEMMTKLVPQMTQNVVSLTLERIEKIVKEIVPGLAEKAIQEEIKRLQKGENES
ncbi:MAG TPA: response regulator [Thermodesulfobacteriota bacterium]|nr:response regulator [Thermodesulfobacteriota bacterium]